MPGMRPLRIYLNMISIQIVAVIGLITSLLLWAHSLGKLLDMFLGTDDDRC